MESSSDIALSKLTTMLTNSSADDMSKVVVEKVNFLITRLSSNPPIHIAEHLLLIADKHPQLFESGPSFEFLLTVLTTSTYATKNKAVTGGKGSSPLCVTTAKVLLTVFRGKTSWPVRFLEAYLDDAACNRMWVDSHECALFTSSLLLWLNARQIPSRSISPANTSVSITGSSNRHEDDHSSSGEEEVLVESEEPSNLAAHSRFAYTEAKDLTVQFISKCLLGKTTVNNFSLLELLCSLVSVPEVRFLLGDHLDKWAGNPAFTSLVRTLLERLAHEIRESYQVSDAAVIVHLVRAKQLFKNDDHRLVLQQLCGADASLCASVMKFVILAEDSQLKQIKPEALRLVISLFNGPLVTRRVDVLIDLLRMQNEVKPWTPIQTRVVVELLYKLIRSTSKSISNATNATNAINANNANRFDIKIFFSKVMRLMDDVLIDSEPIRLLTDVFLCVLLGYSSDMLQCERDSSSSGGNINKTITKRETLPTLVSKPKAKSLFISKANTSRPKSESRVTVPTVDEKMVDPTIKEDLLELCAQLQGDVLDFACLLIGKERGRGRFASALELLSKLLAANTIYMSKLPTDVSASTVPYLKDNGIISLRMILRSVEILKLTASTYDDLTASMDMLESIIIRGMRTKITHIQSDSNEQLIRCIMSLSHVCLLTPLECEAFVSESSIPVSYLMASDTHGNTSIDANMESNMTGNEVNKANNVRKGGGLERALPPLAFRPVYWRACLLSTILACAKPEVIADLAWNSVPSVRLLMLMNISNRFSLASSPVEVKQVTSEPSDVYVYRSKEADLVLWDDCVEVTRCSGHDVESVVLKLEGDIWDAVFLYGFKVRSQLHLVESTSPSTAIVSETTMEDTSAIILEDGSEDGIDERASDSGLIDEDEEEVWNEDLLGKSLLGKSLLGKTLLGKTTIDVSNSDDEMTHVPEVSKPVKKRRIEQLDDEEAPVSRAHTSVSSRGRVRKMRFDAKEMDYNDEEDEPVDNKQESVSKRGRVRKMRYDFRELFAPVSANNASTNTTNNTNTTEHKRKKSIFSTDSIVSNMTTQYGTISRTDLMVLNVKGLARVPPVAIVQQLSAFNDKYNLGANLRNCTDPDFISRAIIGESACDKTQLSRSAIETSSSWLLPAISVDLESVFNRIPLLGAGHLLLMTCLKMLRRIDAFGLAEYAASSVSLAASSKGISVDRLTESFEQEITDHVFHSEDFMLGARLSFAFARKILREMLTPSPKSSITELSNLQRVVLQDMSSHHQERRRAFRLALSVLSAQYQRNEQSMDDQSIRNVLLGGITQRVALDVLTALFASHKDLRGITLEALCSAVRIETDVTQAQAYLTFIQTTITDATSHLLLHVLVYVCSHRETYAKQLLIDSIALITSIHNTLLDSIDNAIYIEGLIALDDHSSSPCLHGFIRHIITNCIIHVSVICTLLFNAQLSTKSDRLINTLTLIFGRNNEILHGNSMVQRSFVPLMSSQDKQDCSTFVSWLPMNTIFDLMCMHLDIASVHFFEAFCHRMEKHVDLVLRQAKSSDLLAFYCRWSSLYPDNKFLKDLQIFIDAKKTKTKPSINASTPSDSNIVLSNNMDTSASVMGVSWDFVKTPIAMRSACLSFIDKELGTLGVNERWSTIIRSALAAIDVLPLRNLIAEGLTYACLSRGLEKEILSVVLESTGTLLNVSCVKCVITEVLGLGDIRVKECILGCTIHMYTSPSACVHLIFIYLALKHLQTTGFSQWNDALTLLIDALILVDITFDSDALALLRCTGNPNPSSAQLRSDLSSLLVKIICQDSRLVSSFTLALTLKLLKKKDNKRLFSFGTSLCRRVAYLIYLLQPEIVSAICITTVPPSIKNFYRFLCPELEANILSVADVEDEPRQTNRSDLYIDISPWVCNDSMPLNETFGSNLIERAIVLEIEEITRATDEAEISRSCDNLVEIFNAHPLLFVRSVPILMREAGLAMNRHKVHLNKQASAIGLIKQGSESCKVVISFPGVRDMKSSAIGVLIARSLRGVNLRGSVTEGIEEALRKVAGLFYG